MCGLFGVVSAPPAALDAALAGRLFSLLHHRGPDDRGWLSLEGRDVRVGSAPDDLHGEVILLHTRLSILDLSSLGHQPMSTPDGRFHLSFNGEIYNYLELRSELESMGRTFASGADTEVLLAAYAEWGSEALGRLVGMFAFSLVDAERRVVVLARDHFGIKPLYYASLPDGLAFASEIPPLLELPGVGRRADPQRVFDYLRFDRSDDDVRTMFAGVRQLQPGHYTEVLLDRPEVDQRRYWALEAGNVEERSLDEAAERLRELFLDNVRLHLRSDVPVGAAFSGGVDSSANVTAMRRLCGDDLDLQTFSYIAEDPEVSEERWIRLVARETGVVSHMVEVTAQELQADLDALIAVQGEPFGSTSIYAQYRVFRLAREGGIKVMLDGQGADELFAGYRFYLPDRVAGLLRRGQAGAAFRLVSAAATLPGAAPGHILLRALAGVLPSTAASAARRVSGNSLVSDWLDGGWLAERGVVLEDPLRGVRGDLRAHRLDSVRSTLRALLRYEDRNSMASSIESRVPFLTPALAEFAIAMPDEYLIARDGTGKLVLRQSLRGLVPDPILDRRDKTGFVTPEGRWLRALAPWVEEVFSSEAAGAAGPLRVDTARRQWHEMRDGRRPFDPMAWRWLNLIRWADRFSVALD